MGQAMLMGEGIYGKSLFLSLSFAMDLKLLFTNFFWESTEKDKYPTGYLSMDHTSMYLKKYYNWQKKKKMDNLMVIFLNYKIKQWNIIFPLLY